MQVLPIKQIGRNAGCLRRSKIALLVADQEASIHIHRVPLEQSFYHPRLRLTTVAEDTVTLDQPVGMMWTKFECIDMRAYNSKLTRHPFVQIANLLLLVKTPRNS